MNKVVHSNNKDDWETPEEFFTVLETIFGKFTLDPCASDLNHKCDKYFTEIQDGLSQSWTNESVFMNPPYSDVKRWMKKACDEAKDNNAFVVCLVASRTDTKWWHDYAMKSSQILFIKGRLKFVGAKDSAPFPSAIVVFANPKLYGDSPRIGVLNKLGV